MVESKSEDQIWIAQFKDDVSKENAFNNIVNKYKTRLYWHLRRMLINHDDTDDALQETFIKTWRYLAEFKEQSSLYTWLYRIATNTALTMLENRKKRKNVGDPTNELDQVSTSDGFDANQLEWKLQLAINTLPEKQKAVFNLRYYDEMPYEMMSEVLDTSVGALKASYHHAAKKIEDYILNH
jgi:RNA polymerase sigma factor (sigma-70 family)